MPSSSGGPGAAEGGSDFLFHSAAEELRLAARSPAAVGLMTVELVTPAELQDEEALSALLTELLHWLAKPPFLPFLLT